MSGKKAEERTGNYQRRVDRTALPGLGKALDSLQPQGLTLLDAVRQLFPQIQAALARECDCVQIAKLISEKTGVRISGKTLAGYVHQVRKEREQQAEEDSPPSEPVKSAIVLQLERQASQQLEPTEGDRNGHEPRVRTVGFVSERAR